MSNILLTNNSKFSTGNILFPKKISSKIAVYLVHETYRYEIVVHLLKIRECDCTLNMIVPFRQSV